MEPSVQAFWVPKLGNTEDEYEDAFAHSVPERRFAIADGATESSYSDRWARSLVQQYTSVPPVTPTGTVPLHEWIAPLQEQWHAGINWDALPWFAEEKARIGAFAALLGVYFVRVEPPPPPRFSLFRWLRRRKAPELPPMRWCALAIGDACLFQIRDGRLVKAFPLERSDAFNDRPLLLSSNPDRNQLVFSSVQVAEGGCLPGDQFYLGTDALARWFLLQHETGKRPWETLGPLQSQSEFATLIDRLRDERTLKNDDTTLLRFAWSTDSVGSGKTGPNS